MASVVPDFAGVTYERLEGNGLQYPVWDMDHPGTPTLFINSFPRGRGKFTPLEFIPVMEEADDEFPFILTTGRVLEHWHGGTMTRHSALERGVSRRPVVEINPADAEMHGITRWHGCPCHFPPWRGGPARHRHREDDSRRSFHPMHFAEAAANLLTNDVLDPQAKIPEFKACAVQVFPARDG